jgi:histidinol-phosphate aminotransferase
MSDFEQFIPAHIRALHAYSPGKPARQAARESGLTDVLKLASNENPFGPSPRALEAISRAAKEANFYPDNDSSELRRALAERHNLPEEQILITGGSTQLIDILCRTLLAPGLNAVTSERSFIVYPMLTRSAGGEIVQAPMTGDAYDLDAIAHAITPATRIVFLSNPNNPTGTMFDAGATDRFLDQLPNHLLVVLDEAYCDYATAFAAQRGMEYSHSLDYVRQGRSLIVLRTFSKAHGLAGLRIGYGMGPAKLLVHFSHMRTAFSVSGIAEAAALAALDDEQHIRRAVESNLGESKRLEQELRSLGARVVQTSGNFIYFDCGEDAGALVKRIQAEGVIVRPMGPWGAPTAVRVTVGTPTQNRRFMAALKHAMERAAARS